MEEISCQTRLQWMTGGKYSVQSLVLVLCEELPLFSLYSSDPRGLQLGDTSGLSSCNKRWNWAVLFWGLLGFGLLGGFLHLLARLGNRPINCIQHSTIWDPKLTGHIAGMILEFWKPQGWMSSDSLAPSPLQGCIFIFEGCLLPLVSMPSSFFERLVQQMRIRAVSVLCKAFEKPGFLHVLEGE